MATVATTLGTTAMARAIDKRRQSIRRLAVFEPAEDLGQVGLLSVHQDADVIDAAGEPENGQDREDEADDGEGDLPGWRLVDRDAHVHDERRAEGKEREGLGDDAVRIPDDAE